MDGSVALKWVSTSPLMCVLFILRWTARMLASVILYARSFCFSTGVRSSAWGKLTRAASLLSATLLFAVNLENSTLIWATVIMWVLFWEVRSWSPFEPRFMRGWVIQVMRVESVCGDACEGRELPLTFMRLLWSIFSFLLHE